MGLEEPRWAGRDVSFHKFRNRGLRGAPSSHPKLVQDLRFWLKLQLMKGSKTRLHAAHGSSFSRDPPTAFMGRKEEEICIVNQSHLEGPVGFFCLHHCPQPRNPQRGQLKSPFDLLSHTVKCSKSCSSRSHKSNQKGNLAFKTHDTQVLNVFINGHFSVLHVKTLQWKRGALRFQ